MEQLCIKNATVIDGTGAKPFIGSVWLKNGKIDRVEKRGDASKSAAADAAQCIDASALTLTPGFIDVHSHGDLVIESAYSTLSKFSQGITTQAAGQCGLSVWPADTLDMARHMRFVSTASPCPSEPKPEDLKSYDAYKAYIDRVQNKPKTELFTGHGALRLAAMGYKTGKPDRKEMLHMQKLLAESLEGGALGMSSGLVYVPGCYGEKEELIELLKIVHEYKGIYATHVRDESNRVEEAEEEALFCAQNAEVPIFISHFKAAGRQNWGKPARILKRFDAAIARGLRLTVDHYPYLAGQTALNVSIPPQYRKDGMEKLCAYLNDPSAVADIRAQMSQAGDYDNYVANCGGFDGVMVSACPKFKEAEGMMVAEYAQKRGMEPFDAYIDILRRNDGLGLGVYFHMCEDDLLTIAAYPQSVIGTDGLLGREGENCHPRAFGCFPHAINYYVKQKKLFPIEEMIRRMSGMSAERLGLVDRGTIQAGKAADLVLMDYEGLQDRATYKQATLCTAGIKKVFLDGKTVYEGK